MINRPKALFFDLDGTLTDSAPGIFLCLRETLTEFGRTLPLDTDLVSSLGPPVQQTFRELLGEENVEAATKRFRYKYGVEEKGITATKLYENIPEMLSMLKNAGYSLSVVTSKNQVIAEKVLAHFGLAHYFAACYGDPGNGIPKGQLITQALHKQNLNSAEVIMVGDRKHDIDAARAANVKCIGVTWGYAPDGEFKSHPPDETISRPMDIFHLFDSTPAPPSSSPRPTTTPSRTTPAVCGPCPRGG